MKIGTILSLILITGNCFPFSAKASTERTAVHVIFVDPAKFTDIRLTEAGGRKERDTVLDELKRMVQTETANFLPGNLQLEIAFRDVDLAGDFEWWKGLSFNGVRNVKDLYPPRMKFTFKLSDQSGKVLEEGERQLTDPAFRFGTGIGERTLLHYDRGLFCDWLRKEFRKYRK